jgi:hypothetical protein
MDQREARHLVEACLPKLARLQAGGGGLQTPVTTITIGAAAAASVLIAGEVRIRPLATLWAGMGHVYELTANVKQAAVGGESDRGGSGRTIAIVAKRVQLPAVCSSLGDQRKKDSYHVEAAFYSRGHAARVHLAGAACPRVLYVDQQGARGGADLTICMTCLVGSSSSSMPVAGAAEAFVRWLATLHALYWGSEQADAAVATGLQVGGLMGVGSSLPERKK